MGVGSVGRERAGERTAQSHWLETGQSSSSCSDVSGSLASGWSLDGRKGQAGGHIGGPALFSGFADIGFCGSHWTRWFGGRYLI